MAAEGGPAEFFGEEVVGCEGFVDGGVEGVGGGVGGAGGVGEEGGGGGWVGERVVCVDVCEVRGVGEVAVEEAREERGLDRGGEQVGDYLEACLPSGLGIDESVR